MITESKIIDKNYEFIKAKSCITTQNIISALCERNEDKTDKLTNYCTATLLHCTNSAALQILFGNIITEPTHIKGTCSIVYNMADSLRHQLFARMQLLQRLSAFLSFICLAFNWCLIPKLNAV